jgi:hypothetical protein
LGNAPLHVQYAVAIQGSPMFMIATPCRCILHRPLSLQHHLQIWSLTKVLTLGSLMDGK